MSTRSKRRQKMKQRRLAARELQLMQARALLAGMTFQDRGDGWYAFCRGVYIMKANTYALALQWSVEAMRLELLRDYVD